MSRSFPRLKYILSNEHPNFGLGRNSWLSGTSSWAYQASTKYILGIRPEHNGLRIEPCIPKSWEGFTVERTCRGCVYNITVKNPKNVSCGVTKLTLDGKEIAGSIVPWQTDNKVHNVEIVLG